MRIKLKILKNKVNDCLLEYINIINFYKLIQKQIQILVENLSNVINYLTEDQKNTFLNSSDLILLALSKIENLDYVIEVLNVNEKKLILGLSIETLQDQEFIKKAFGINFEIKMKKPD